MDVGCTYKVVRGAICTLDQDTHPEESDDEWGGADRGEEHTAALGRTDVPREWCGNIHIPEA